MSIAIDSRLRKLVGKALLYPVAAVILGLAVKRVMPEDMAKVLA